MSKPAKSHADLVDEAMLASHTGGMPSYIPIKVEEFLELYSCYKINKIGVNVLVDGLRVKLLTLLSWEIHPHVHVLFGGGHFESYAFNYESAQEVWDKIQTDRVKWIMRT